MPYPRNIRLALQGRGIPSAHVPPEGECEGAKFHSPTPLMVYPHRLGGKNHRSVLLCGTCYDNLQTFMVLMEAHGGELSWPIRREFGNLLRALGEEQWRNENG